MSDEFEEHPGLIDEDPALDYILYKKLEKEDSQDKGRGGCQSLMLAMIVPPVGVYFLLDCIAKLYS